MVVLLLRIEPPGVRGVALPALQDLRTAVCCCCGGGGPPVPPHSCSVTDTALLLLLQAYVAGVQGPPGCCRALPRLLALVLCLLQW